MARLAAYIAMACKGMAYMVVAYIAMACEGMAYIVVACIVMWPVYSSHSLNILWSAL